MIFTLQKYHTPRRKARKKRVSFPSATFYNIFSPCAVEIVN